MNKDNTIEMSDQKNKKKKKRIILITLAILLSIICMPLLFWVIGFAGALIIIYGLFRSDKLPWWWWFQ